jgi:prevent-host-death family protein
MPDGHAPAPGDLVVEVEDAEARFGELIERAERGERVVIVRGGRPIAVLQPNGMPPAKKLGFLREEMAPEDLVVLEAQLDQLEREGWYTEEELDEFEGELDLELRDA